MFNKILIPNRGEIALRIMRTCKKMGITPILAYSNIDKESLPVKSIKEYKGEAYPLGSDDLKDSYLNIEKILNIAEKSEAEAVHPGYGLLSQNIDFAKGCKSCGIKFIGPTEENFLNLNKKLAFRNKAKYFGLKVVPGTFEEIKSYEEAKYAAEKLGYPVIVKADEGGGGRGMRVANNMNELENAISIAGSEARNAFNNSRVYIEKLLNKPRHIEFQVLGDGKNVVHFGERECSIQRKHQKLIEETPSPIITEEVRENIGRRAVDFLKSLNYKSAGTIESLRDEKGNFYFLEFNGRIQVEHLITEMVTGMDIVEEQIKIEAGEDLRYHQNDIKLNGHAIDFRINAEDPSSFKPNYGTITKFIPPVESPNVRIDTALHTDYNVPLIYDSLIAKVAVRGKNRNETIELGKKALNETIIEGVKTTIPRHIEILDSELFKSGNTTTEFLEEYEKYQALFESIQNPKIIDS